MRIVLLIAHHRANVSHKIISHYRAWSENTSPPFCFFCQRVLGLLDLAVLASSGQGGTFWCCDENKYWIRFFDEEFITFFIEKEGFIVNTGPASPFTERQLRKQNIVFSIFLDHGLELQVCVFQLRTQASALHLGKLCSSASLQCVWMQTNNLSASPWSGYQHIN